MEYGAASRRLGVYINRSIHSGKVNGSKDWTKKRGQQLERSNLISESLPEASGREGRRLFVRSSLLVEGAG